MDKAKLIQRLMATFLEELDEHLRSLNDDLLALEKGPEAGPDAAGRSERLKNLFRTAHSLKGAARSVNVGLIERVCHQVEDILTGVRAGARPLDADLFALLFGAADALEEAGMRLREQKDLSDAPLAGLLPRLEAAAAAVGPRRPAPAVEAAGAEPPDARPAVAAHAESSGPGTLRISADKLDAFLARNGELLVARLRVQSRAEDLAAVREHVSRWRAEWRPVEKALAGWFKDGDGPARGPAPAGDGRPARAVPRRVAHALRRAGENLKLLEKDLDRLTAILAGDGRLLDQVGSALDDEVRRVRMFPFAEACQGLERAVRDVALAKGKEAALAVEGGTVELDRSVLEGLKDPLRHLVRNAVDHGLEPPAERRAAGKPAQGRVTVAATLRGSQVEVVVADDGRGLDLDALRQQARKRRLPEPPDERELARLIFLPGLSTARIITDISGRGVGLDVVKSHVEALHGTVDVSFRPGQGTRFTLAVPLTLTTNRALLLGAGGQTFALVSTNVQQLVRVDPADFRPVEGRDTLSLGGPPLPVAWLAETLGLSAHEPPAGGKVLVLVVAAGEQRMAFVVDELLAEQEIVIKHLGARIRRTRHVSGATIMPSGRVALVLNAANLIRTALARAPARARAPAAAGAAPEARPRILVAEDSLTTRTLMRSILEAAGYDATAVADGVAAWEALQGQGADLVVTDVDMPRMDGFALAEAVRADPRFRELPVVLVTARETEEDKARGIAVGADAYLVKSAFDQTNLLETVAQLL